MITNKYPFDLNDEDGVETHRVSDENVEGYVDGQYPFKAEVESDTEIVLYKHGGAPRYVEIPEHPFSEGNTLAVEFDYRKQELVLSRLIPKSEQEADSGDTHPDPVPVAVGKLVPPWVSELPIETTVTSDNTIDIGITETPLKEDTLEEGTEVTVKNTGQRVVADPSPSVDTDAVKQSRWKGIRDRQRKRREEKRNRERNEFWQQYDIDFDFSITVNTRKSELQRGSTGTGQTVDTVDHVILLESLSKGQLERDKYEFLCGNKGERGHYGQQELSPEPTAAPTRIVTCQTCLKRLKRWKHTDG